MKRTIIAQLFILALLPFCACKADTYIKYTAVHDYNTLKNGDVVIIVNDTHTKAMAQYTYNKGRKNRATVEVFPTQDDVILISPDSLVSELSLEKTNGDYWTLKDAKGYITSPAPDKNELTAETKVFKERQKTSLVQIMKDKDGIHCNIIFKGNKRCIDLFADTYFSCYDTNRNFYSVQLFLRDKEVEAVRIGEEGYATLYYETKSHLVPQSLTAYNVYLHNNKMIKGRTYVSGQPIPKGEAVILQGPSQLYELTPDTNSLPIDANNKLKGKEQKLTIESQKSLFYKLSLNKRNELNSVGFYWDSPNGHFITTKAHRAYLEVPANLGLSQSYLLNSLPTSISQSIIEKQKISHIYELNGVEVVNPHHGIYIIDGKKIMIK